MSRFIKLTNQIINVNQIAKIELFNRTSFPVRDEYTIYINNNEMRGVFLFTVGFINSNYDHIVVSKSKNPTDYQTITHFIEQTVMTPEHQQ